MKLISKINKNSQEQSDFKTKTFHESMDSKKLEIAALLKLTKLKNQTLRLEAKF